MSIYRLHVRLEDIWPLIWRRFQVCDDISFHRLHLTLQVVMGWENYHLYEFALGAVTLIPGAALAEIGPIYGRPAAAARLSSHLQASGDTCQYTYDFGDAWRHRVTLEAIEEEEEIEKIVTPYCLAGAQACPPEDCGGVGGYEHLLAALGDPGHPRHDRCREWLGGSFDPERFDREASNRRLREGMRKGASF